MRRLIAVLLVLSAAVGLALLVHFNEGNVAILWPPYRVDLSINLFAILLISAVAAAFAIVYMFFNAIALPQRVRDFRQRRARQAAIRGFRDSLIALFEGRYGRSERLIKPALEDTELSGVAALIAARAAQRLNDPERLEQWLERAESEPGLAQAVLLTRAEFALDGREPARALQAIDRLHAGGARHIQALRLALKAHEQSGRWPDVLQGVRQLVKRDALHPSVARSMTVRALRAQFAAARDNSERLDALFRSLSVAERRFEEVVEVAAPALAEVGRTEQAMDLLLGVLRDHLDDRLVAVLARLEAVSSRDRLREIEALRARHGEHPSLTLAAGRLCAAESLWGKSEEFLRRAVVQAPGQESLTTLAALLEHLGQHDEAASLWRSAALFERGDPLPERPAAPLVAHGLALPPHLPDTPELAQPENEALERPGASR
ncbi:MAG: hypothetical protein RL322_727 [Pseudomonadota bacterium]|jgi:HemY protein